MTLHTTDRITATVDASTQKYDITSGHRGALMVLKGSMISSYDLPDYVLQHFKGIEAYLDNI